MRGFVIVEGNNPSKDSTMMLVAHYYGGEKGLIEVSEIPERDDLFAQWLLGGIVTCTDVPMVLAMPWSDRFTVEQLEEVGKVGEDAQAFRIKLTSTQFSMMRYHFGIIGSGTAAGMMQKLPPYAEQVPGRPRMVVNGNFIPLRPFRRPGRLSRVLGDELAELVLRLHSA